MIGSNQTKVLLPAWIFEQAQDKEEIKRLVLDYMQRYPGYTVLKVTGRFAVCEINR
ncbi:hypothetical protein [Virgibacillus salexigens]|uniref:hypothetical protein n=1 Tax=Virgibacillus salexigens TaxID=61016 RepID=UPI0019093204|nr:hypothetical protein [Virgibacillus salexigens]